MRTTDIMNAVTALLNSKWPDRTVYWDLCPVDFARPSFWLQVTREERSDASQYALRCTVQLTLTLFDTVNEHYEASWQRLSGDADECLTLLGGVLRVGQRRFKPTLRCLPREVDRMSILIDLSFMTPRAADGQTEETAETLCASLTVNGKKIQ